MIQTLARKRIELAALGVVLALLAALFVTVTPTRAAVGDVTASAGWCTFESGTDPAEYRLTTDEGGSTAITVQVPDADDTDGETGDAALFDDIEIACSAAQNRMAVSIAPNGSRSPTVTYHEPEVVVSFGAPARAGASIPVRAYVKNQRVGATYTADAAMYSATVSPTTGASIPAPASEITTIDAATAAAPAVISNLILLPSATGTYTVTVNLAVDHVAEDTRPDGFVAGQAEATVGEDAAVIDTKVATVSLELGMSALDNPLTSLNEGKAEDNTEPATGGDIWLKLTTLNSLDKPAANSDLTSLVVFGRGATLTIHRANATNTAPAQLADSTVADADAIVGATTGTENSATHSTAADITHTMFVKVEAIGANPAQVPVTAYINGVQSNTVDLIFTGSTTAISVTEAAKTLASKNGELKFTVTGLDKAGNGGTALPENTVNYRVLDADGDNVASNPSVAKAQTPTATGTNPNSVTLTVTTSDTTAAKSGTYTLEVTLGSDTKTAQTVEFNVAGPPANVDLVADPMSSSTVGERIQLTATVTDEAGVNVPDGTEVTFAATEGGGAAIISGATAKTVDGVAKGLLGVSGSGTTFVYATAGDANGTLTFVSTAVSGDAVEEVISAANCLSSLSSGFSTWTCEGTGMASDIFGDLNSRGASAVHLWNGAAWVRYAVVDGAEVPGSTDFLIAKNNTLYISY